DFCRIDPWIELVEQHREQKGTRIVISAVAFLKIGHGENRVLKYTGAIRHPEKMIKAQWRKLIRLRGERLVREGPSSDGAPASRSRIAKRFHVALGPPRAKSSPGRADKRSCASDLALSGCRARI